MAIVEDLDVLRDLLHRLFPGEVPAMMDQFVFQYPPEALDWGVVIAVAAPTHRSLHAELLEEFAVFQGAILAPPI